MRTPTSLSVLLLASVALSAPVMAQDAPVAQLDSTYPAPWGAGPSAEESGGAISFVDAVWSPDVDATTTTDRWDTTLTLEHQGLEGLERRAEDIVLDGENADAFEIRENTCVGETAPGQTCGVRVGLREGVADGTYTVYVRDAVSGRSARVTVRLERPRDVDLVISGTVLNYDVGAAAAAAGWQPGMGVNLTILPGSIVGSAGTWAPALRIGGFAGPVRQVTVINRGRIQGAGGQGGMGAGSEGARFGIWWPRGQNGGPAIRAETAVSFWNLGQIWGGGGGGGSGHCRVVYFAAGSGGGGAGFVGGQGGPQTGERFPSQGPGQPGSTETGGAGSCSQIRTGYACPSGGVPETTTSSYCYSSDSESGGRICDTTTSETGRCVITIRPASGCTGGTSTEECNGSYNANCWTVTTPVVCADPGEFVFYEATPTFDRCGGRGGGPGEPGQAGFGGWEWCGGNEAGQAGSSVDGSGWISWQAFGDVRGPLR